MKGDHMSVPWTIGRHKTLNKALRQALLRLYHQEPFSKVVLGPAKSCRHHGTRPGHLEEVARTAVSVTYKAFDERGVRTLTVLRTQEGPPHA